MTNAEDRERLRQIAQVMEGRRIHDFEVGTFLRSLASQEPGEIERLREATGKAVERMAGPLGRARSRALDGVSDVEQMRDLEFIYDGVKELRAALSDPDTRDRS